MKRRSAVAVGVLAIMMAPGVVLADSDLGQAWGNPVLVASVQADGEGRAGSKTHKKTEETTELPAQGEALPPVVPEAPILPAPPEPPVVEQPAVVEQPPVEPAPVVPEKPLVHTGVNAPYQYELEFYQSYYNVKERNRTINLELAANALDGYILAPGGTCSFNEIVGERTRARGYEDARIIMNGEYVLGLGGGICQVSSSLFNAALYSDMTIVTRVNHGIASTYVPRGRDATVAWGYIDFVFKNPFEVPVKLVVKAENGVLRMSFCSQTQITREPVTLKVTEKNGLYTLRRYSGDTVTYTATSRYKR